jgi:hypothetical protein
VIAEQELSPIATAFNRLLIASIAFALWNTLQFLKPSQAARSPAEVLPLIQSDKSDRSDQTGQAGNQLGSLGLLIFAGLCFAASLSLSA